MDGRMLLRPQGIWVPELGHPAEVLITIKVLFFCAMLNHMALELVSLTASCPFQLHVL